MVVEAVVMRDRPASKGPSARSQGGRRRAGAPYGHARSLGPFTWRLPECPARRTPPPGQGAGV